MIERSRKSSIEKHLYAVISGLVYAILWLGFNVFSRVFLRYRTIGKEYIPRKGGVLFAANHASSADIPLLGCGIPRRVAYMGRATLFGNRVFNWVFRFLGWIPLKPDRIDRKAFGDAISLTKEGMPVVIFPEGSRSMDGHLKRGKLGIGIIVAETQCPVIPVYISGSGHVLPMGSFRLRFYPVTIHFGEPMEFSSSPDERSRAFYEYVSTAVMTRIADLGHVPYPDEQKMSRSVSEPFKVKDEAGKVC